MSRVVSHLVNCGGAAQLSRYFFNSLLRSVPVENLANHLFSTLLFVVLVSQVFIGQVGFFGKVGF